MRILPYLIFAASILIAPVATFVAAARPSSAGPYLVLMPPWMDADLVVSRAGGRLVGPFTAPFAVLATTQGDGTSPTAQTFSAELLRQGAWALRDPGALSSICGLEAGLNT